MADNEKDLKLKLTAEDNATDVIKKISAALGQSELGQSITAASTAFLALKGAGEIAIAAFSKVAGAVGATVEAAAESEKAQRALATAMVQTGNYSAENEKKINALAAALQATTGTSDEATKEMVTLGLNMGMTADQAQKTAEAAINMGAALNIDANTAMKQLSMTMNGSLGLLGKSIPQLKNYTEEQLRSGAAIEYVVKNMSGQAAMMSQTYAGGMKKAREAWGDVLEAIGSFITKNPVVISSLNVAAKAFTGMAESIQAAADYIEENGETIKTYALALGIATAAVGAYLIAMNWATISTTALTVAQIALKAAMAATPFGLIVLAIGALTVAIGWLIENSDKAAGAIKVGLGYALQVLSVQIRAMLTALGYAVGVFNKDWGDALKKASASISEYADGLKKSGSAQMEAAANAEKGKATMEGVSTTIKGMEKQAEASRQAFIRMSRDLAKAADDAKGAFDAVKDLAPRLSLKEFERTKADYESALKNLQAKSTLVITTIQKSGGAKTDDEKAALKQAVDENAKAQEAIAALKLKYAIEVRNTQIKEVDIALNTEKMKAISVSDEIKMKRISSEDEIRNQRIAILTATLLEQEGIERNALDITTAARLNAYNLDLANYKTQLDAQMQLAVDVETQKQIALAEIKKGAMSGLGGGAGAGAEADATIANEETRQAKLTELYQNGELSRSEYRRAMVQSELIQMQAENAEEEAIRQQKIEMLSLSTLGQQEAMLAAKQAYEDQVLAINMNTDLTEEQRKAAIEQSEMDHQARINQIKEDYAQRELQRNVMLRDKWGETLANIKLQQEKHGKVMGMIQGVQASAQFQAMNQGFTAMSGLMQSENTKMFGIGKAFAIGQAVINTFLAATGAFAALAPIPIVGPALAIAAAAMITAGGAANIARIAAQQPPKGGQADQGMDSIPESLAGKSFILSAGERVVQPEANKELTKAVDKINNGGGAGGGNNFYATFNVAGADEGTLMKLKDQVIDWIREASERGQPVVNEKGIVRA